MYANTRSHLDADAKTLPARHFTDPELFQRELDAIHRQMWLHAGRAAQIPEPGDYFLVELAGDSVIVLRGQDDQPRAFHNFCRHRGTRLCRAAEGRLPGRIQCPYHAWTYGLDGELLQAPHMEKTDAFERRLYPLKTLAVDVWDGHLFINLASDPPPLAEHLDGLPARFRSWGMEELRLAHRIVYPVKANWKLILHNYSECLHCPNLHPQLQNLSHYMSGDNEPPRPTWLGGRMKLRPDFDTLTSDGKSPWRPLPGLDPEERRVVCYYAVLPNLLLNLHPDFMLTFALWPRSYDHTDIVCEWHFHPDEMARRDFDPGPAVDFWDLTNRQDWEISELAQLGIASSAYSPGPYSNREELLYALDRFVLDRLGMVAET